MEGYKITLSFVVPIYGVEKYLDKCVQSLLSQDYNNFEIVLVDDESPDNCPEMCDEYASKYQNIQVVHRKNGGLSAARNSGVDVAKGKYICFVDSDDYWNENVLGLLMALIEKDDLDVLRFKWQYVNEEYKIVNPYKSDPYMGHDFTNDVTDGVNFLDKRQGTACYACQYILNANILSQERFTEGILFEDTDWTPRMMLKARRVASTDTVVYNYLIRPGSITNALNFAKQKEVLENKMRIVVEMQRQANILKSKSLPNKWFDGMIAATVESIAGLISTLFWRERKEYVQRLKKMNIWPLKSKSSNFKIMLLNLNLNFTLWLLHIKNR